MTDDLEQKHRIMTSALRAIAAYGDCDYYGDEKGRPKPCPCQKCTAEYALKAYDAWRFVGASPERLTAHNPREKAIHDEWVKCMDVMPPGRGADNSLSKLLKQAELPTVRDWYVATTVVQWMVSNVGETLLFAAGYRHKTDAEAAATRWTRVVEQVRGALAELNVALAISGHRPDELLDTRLFMTVDLLHKIIDPKAPPVPGRPPEFYRKADGPKVQPAPVFKPGPSSEGMAHIPEPIPTNIPAAAVVNGDAHQPVLDVQVGPRQYERIPGVTNIQLTIHKHSVQPKPLLLNELVLVEGVGEGVVTSMDENYYYVQMTGQPASRRFIDMNMLSDSTKRMLEDPANDARAKRDLARVKRLNTLSPVSLVADLGAVLERVLHAQAMVAEFDRILLLPDTLETKNRVRNDLIVARQHLETILDGQSIMEKKP